jgi:hypothetical protein
MKTYDVFGAVPLNISDAENNLAHVQKIALRVQSALHAEMFAREDRSPYAQYRHMDFDDAVPREIFVVSNVAVDGKRGKYPEFDETVIVAVGAPNNPDDSRSLLEALGLTLLRRRRREYALPSNPPPGPVIDLFGSSVAADAAVRVLSPMLGMAFDGNEQAASGGDSHYYDESERFGTILVFSNETTKTADQPFPDYSRFATVVIVVNSPERDYVNRVLLDNGFMLLKTTGSDQPS